MEPSNAQARWHLARANALASGGEPAKAVGEYRAAIALDSTLAEAQAALGAVLLELNRAEEAREAFTRACELRPDMAEYRLGLSAATTAAGEPDQGFLALLGAGRPLGRWQRVAAGASLSFVVGVLVLAAFDDPKVALTLLIVPLVLLLGYLRARHRPIRPALLLGLVALLLIAAPIAVQSGFDVLHRPWNFVLLGAYCALGAFGFWVDRRRRRRS